MSEQLHITVENKLVKERRDLHIYHNSSKSAHIISHNSSIDFSLQKVETDDYLYISMIKGPENLTGDCLIHLPPWLDFEFISRGDLTCTYRHRGDVQPMVLKIPPGPPLWELKLMRAGDEETRDIIKVTIGEK